MSAKPDPGGGSAPPAGSWRLALRLGWIAAAAIALAAVFASASTRDMLAAAAAKLDLLAALPILPVQLAASGLSAWSLWSLRPGPSLLACLASRWLRDAGGNLLVVAPGLGEIAGARLLVLAGGSSAAVVSASALDVLAETIAQIPFALLALVAVPRLWTMTGVQVPGPGVAAMAALLPVAAAASLLRAGPRAVVGAALRRLVQRLAPLRAAFAQRRGAVPGAILLHLLAWLSGGFQVFLAARAVGAHLDLGGAFVIESFVYAVRGLLFVVPAGLGVQEASFVAAGLVFGLTAEQGLAVSLLLRVRDLVLGAPALLAWLMAEAVGRRGVRRALFARQRYPLGPARAGDGEDLGDRSGPTPQKGHFSP